LRAFRNKPHIPPDKLHYSHQKNAHQKTDKESVGYRQTSDAEKFFRRDRYFHINTKQKTSGQNQNAYSLSVKTKNVNFV
jgi:hypothetical protein